MVPQITADDVKKSIDSKENVILLDVRTPVEFSRGKIGGSVNLPVDDVAEKIIGIVPNKNQKIYVYCLSGLRSDVAVETMIQLDYTNVFSMTSGLLMWRSKKYSLDL